MSSVEKSFAASWCREADGIKVKNPLLLCRRSLRSLENSKQQQTYPRRTSNEFSPFVSLWKTIRVSTVVRLPLSFSGTYFNSITLRWRKPSARSFVAGVIFLVNFAFNDVC